MKERWKEGRKIGRYYSPFSSKCPVQQWTRIIALWLVKWWMSEWMNKFIFGGEEMDSEKGSPL